MGKLYTLYPNPHDSLDGDLFGAYKKYYALHTDKLFQALLDDKKTTIVTDTGQEIVCTLQQPSGKDFVKNPYGREYHILLESDEGKRFGCHIEHRLRPVTREIRSQRLYPSSWVVNNGKFDRVFDSRGREAHKKAQLSPSEVSLA